MASPCPPPSSCGRCYVENASAPVSYIVLLWCTWHHSWYGYFFPLHTPPHTLHSPCSPILDRLSKQLVRSEEHTSELQSHSDLVCRLLLDNKTASASRKGARPNHSDLLILYAPFCLRTEYIDQQHGQAFRIEHMCSAVHARTTSSRAVAGS